MRLFATCSLLLNIGCALAIGAERPAGHIITWGNGWGAHDDAPWTLVGGAHARLAGRMTNAVRVAAGLSHSTALLQNGKVVSRWPRGYESTRAPEGLSNVVAVAAGGAINLALKDDGTVAAWGHTSCVEQLSVPADLTNVVSVSAGHRQCFALKEDGTVAAWGRYVDSVPEGLQNVIAVAAGGSRFERNLALKKDGTVVGWGEWGKDVPAGLSNVVAIAVGEHHSLALLQDGTVMGWGENSSGEATGVPTDIPPYRASGLVRVSGQVVSNVVAIATGNEYGLTGTYNRYSLALKEDGTVVGWGGWSGMTPSNQIVPEGVSNIVAIAAGNGFCLAITTNAAVAERFER